MRRSAYIAVLSVLTLAACIRPGGQEGVATIPAQGVGGDISSDLEAIRAVVASYWGAFNSYDLERTLSFLEPAYREEQAETIAGEIRSLKLFGVKMGVSEESEPSFLSPEEAELIVKLAVPFRDRRVYQHLVKIDGVWKIDVSMEIKE